MTLSAKVKSRFICMLIAPIAKRIERREFNDFAMERVFLEYDESAGWGWKITVNGVSGSGFSIDQALADREHFVELERWKERTRAQMARNSQ